MPVTNYQWLEGGKLQIEELRKREFADCLDTRRRERGREGEREGGDALDVCRGVASAVIGIANAGASYRDQRLDRAVTAHREIRKKDEEEEEKKKKKENKRFVIIG
jgi:hypothetical protein